MGNVLSVVGTWSWWNIFAAYVIALVFLRYSRLFNFLSPIDALWLNGTSEPVSSKQRSPQYTAPITHKPLPSPGPHCMVRLKTRANPAVIKALVEKYWTNQRFRQKPVHCAACN